MNRLGQAVLVGLTLVRSLLSDNGHWIGGAGLSSPTRDLAELGRLAAGRAQAPLEFGHGAVDGRQDC